MSEIANHVEHISSRALRLMRTKNLVTGAGRPVFYAWPLPDRLVLLVDPEMVKIAGVLSDGFRHDLSTVLGGRRVVTTNSRGVFLQIAYRPDPAPHALESAPLDLSAQPTPLSVPVGMTAHGPLWLSILEIDSALIGGARRMGKTRLQHAWIQALAHGGLARLTLWSGKGGMEFYRYAAYPTVEVARDLRQALASLMAEFERRKGLMASAGASSLAEYNAGRDFSQQLPPVVLFIDEVASTPKDLAEMLGTLIGLTGATGIYPVLATTYPGSQEVQSCVKANLSTRICFPVPTHYESKVVLGHTGAEKLPKVKGRLMLVWNAHLLEAQAFEVSLPPLGAVDFGPALTGQELALVKHAIDAGGRMSMALCTAWDSTLSLHAARKLVERFEARGWLAKDPQRDNARFITPLLLDILAQTAQTAQTPQTAQTVEANQDVDLCVG